MNPTNRATTAKIASQIGGELLADSDRWMNRFQIKSQTSDREYVIAQQRSDNVWGCSCPGWRNHRRCKHLTDVLGRLAKIADQYECNEMMASARTAYLILEPIKGAKFSIAPGNKGRVLDL